MFRALPCDPVTPTHRGVPPFPRPAEPGRLHDSCAVSVPGLPYSKSDPVSGHGKNGLDHRVGTRHPTPHTLPRTCVLTSTQGWCGAHRRRGPGDPAHPPACLCLLPHEGQTTTRHPSSVRLQPPGRPQGWGAMGPLRGIRPS